MLKNNRKRQQSAPQPGGVGRKNAPAPLPTPVPMAAPLPVTPPDRPTPYAFFGRDQLPFFFIYLLFAALLLGAGRGDLWLDEIWSLSFPQNVKHWTEIFFIHHDNNNILNSLYLYLIGAQTHFIVYRLFAICCGLATIVLAGHVARRDWGYRTALCAAVLICSSYPMLVYFSEARGYGPVMLCSMLAYALLRHNMVEPRWHKVVLFWIVSVLGVLSHPIYSVAAGALMIMHAAAVLRPEGTLRRRIAIAAAHHTPALAFIGFWYLFFMRHMEVGGAPVNIKLDVITEGSALMLGIPPFQPLPQIALLLIVTLIAASAILMLRDRRAHWAFFPGVTILSPLVTIVVMKPVYFYFRYFCTGYVFFNMLLAYLGCRLYAPAGKALRVVLVVAGLLLLAGQSARIVPLMRYGRGNYQEPLAYILEHSGKRPATLSGDHDFRVTAMLGFYGPMLDKTGKAFRYEEEAEWQIQAPEWYLGHAMTWEVRPSQAFQIPGVGIYRLVAVYPYSGLSGWHWILYHRLEGATLKNPGQGGRP